MMTDECWRSTDKLGGGVGVGAHEMSLYIVLELNLLTKI